MTQKNHKQNEAISLSDDQWLGLALPDEDEPRAFLHYFYSTGERMIASNGHVAHIVFKKEEKGFYEGMIKLDKEDFYGVHMKYPDINKVIPKHNNNVVKFRDLQDFQPPFYKDFDGGFLRIYKFANIEVSAQYMEHAALGFDDPVIEYNDGDHREVLMIKSNDRLAIIKPLKQER